MFCYIAMEIYVIGCTSISSSSFCPHTINIKTCLCISDGLYHSPTMNYTLSTSKQSTKSLSKAKQLCIQTMILYKGRWCFSRSQTPLYILIKRKQIKKLPKNYPPQGPHVIPHLITRNKITWFLM